MKHRVRIILFLAITMNACTSFDAAKKNFLVARKIQMQEIPYALGIGPLVKTIKLDGGITRYVFHIDFIKKGTCKYFEDVDGAKEKMIDWGYLGNPDFCIMPIDWSQFM